MSNSPEQIIQMMQDAESNERKFIHAMLRFHIHSFQHISFNPGSRILHCQFEKCMIASLALIETMHLNMITRRILLTELFCLHEETALEFDDRDIELAILELQRHIKHYPFSNITHKMQCRKIVKQIKTYHFHHHVKVIVLDTALPKPWKPAHYPILSQDVTYA